MIRLDTIKTGTLCALLALFVPASTNAQLPSVDRLKKTVSNAVESEILAEADRLARDATRCVFDNLECIRDAEANGEEVVLTDSDGELITDDEGMPVQDTADLPPEYATPAASTTFDFEPGERVLFEDDFSAENRGDFPQTLEYIRGTMEVVDMNDGRPFLLTTAAYSQFAIVLPGTLPDRFTIEFDIHDTRTEGGTWISTTEFGSRGQIEGNVFNFGHWRGSGIWIDGREPLATGDSELMTKEVVTARIMADGKHVKAWINESRVSNVPSVDFERSDRIYFSIEGRDDRPIYIGNMRIAAGGADLYDVLASEGRVEIHDILFDTGSDVIRPESFPILEEIGTMLSDHPDLNLMVEGHTDNQGDFDYNMTLSGERAASVKSYLVETFSIEADRLRTMGLGSTRPVDANDTAEGMQRNRRVELVRM